MSSLIFCFCNKLQAINIYILAEKALFVNRNCKILLTKSQIRNIIDLRRHRVVYGLYHDGKFQSSFPVSLSETSWWIVTIVGAILYYDQLSGNEIVSS